MKKTQCEIDHEAKTIEAAKKAAKTGNRKDLQEYLKLRRER